MKGIEPIRGFDFHCHVDLYPDPTRVIAACERKGIVTLAVTTTPKAWLQNRRWTRGSRYVFPALGLHPELVGERHHEIALLEEHMKESRLIGEIGLDGSRQYQKSWQAQVEVFTRALAAAQHLGGRVLSIHSRRAESKVVESLKEYTTADRVLPILHWFSGSITVGHKAASIGCYFSINQHMLEHERGRRFVKSLPEDRLLTETDAPFTSMGDRKSEPADVIMTTERLAVARGVSVADLKRILRSNAMRVFYFIGARSDIGLR